jgi:hypothetical protein
MDIFYNSTHTDWIMSKEQLDQERQKTAAAASERFHSWAEKHKVTVTPISLLEIKKLIVFYETRIKDFCKAFQLSTRTKAISQFIVVDVHAAIQTILYSKQSTGIRSKSYFCGVFISKCKN